MKNAQQHSPIAVAVSGGADSLFCLMELQARGEQVMALHGIFFPPRNDRERKEGEAVREGLALNCRELGVPLVALDLSRDFLELVIRPFVQSYARGLTPNPCALCNARIKFGLLQDAALAHGAAFLATGHYARLRQGYGPEPPALFQGLDDSKDQSYFLALTPPARLEKALFPLGARKKKDVLETLSLKGISIPQPRESQEVCFVPDDAYRDFLPRMAEELGIALPGPGPMLLGNGRRVGTHGGLWQYTEGQRKGLGIGWTEPLHVLAKECEGNILRLGPRREMRAGGCLCREVNVLLPPGEWPERALVKTRYRERPKPARVELDYTGGDRGENMRIRFLEPDAAVAPGQVAAVYVPGEEQGEPGLRLAAGGIISEALAYSSSSSPGLCL